MLTAERKLLAEAEGPRAGVIIHGQPDFGAGGWELREERLSLATAFHLYLCPSTAYFFRIN